MGTFSNLSKKIASRIAAGVSIMWCAYLFATGFAIDNYGGAARSI